MSRPNIGRDLLNVPMGDMIRDMAFAIADAQIRLDSNSVEVAQMLGGLRQIAGLNGEVAFEDSRVFFGKEKMTLSSICDIYNSSSDRALRATLLSQAIKPSNTLSPSLVPFWPYGDTPAPGSGATLPGSGTDGELFNDTTGVDAGWYQYATASSSWVKLNDDPTMYRLKAGAVNGTYYVPAKVSMLELGFTPTFYQFVDTIIEVKINISFTESREATLTTTTNTKNSGLSGKFALLGPAGGAQIKRSVSTSQVNASFSSKFSYTAEGSSLLRTKLTPIPPPAILEERIRDLMEMARENTTTNAPTA